MLLFDDLVRGRKIIYAIILSGGTLEFFGGTVWLILSSLLQKWYTIKAMFVIGTNMYWLVFSGDQDIFLTVDCDVILREDRNITQVYYVADAINLRLTQRSEERQS